MVRWTLLATILMVALLMTSLPQDARGGSVLSESTFSDGILDNVTHLGGLRLDFGERATDWTLAGSSPRARSNGAMAYSSSDDLAILFGGRDDFGNLLQDTWQLMDGRWMPLSPRHSPVPRQGHSLVHIGSTDEILLFGGEDGEWQFNDLVRFDLSIGDWQAIDTSTRPGARAYHQMVYDPDNDVAILLGGLHVENFRVWAYHPGERRWEAIEPREGAEAPPMTQGISATYIGDGRVLMFGGAPTDYRGTDVCWIYHYATNTWDRVQTNTFPHALAMPAVHVPERDEVMFYGHYTSEVNTHTWLLNLTSMEWSSPTLESEPGPLGYYSMVYLTSRREVALFGGGLPPFYGTSGWPPPDSPTTWLFDVDSRVWTKLRPTALSPVVHVPGPEGLVVNHFGVWRRGLGEEWSMVLPDGDYSYRGAASVHLRRTKEVLFFGGMWPFPSGSGGPLSYTYRLDLVTMEWDINRTASPPSGRIGHTLVYDDVTGKVLMFGGNGYYTRPDSLFGDSWSFDPGTGVWTDTTPSLLPSPRTEHVMVAIPGTGESMLFGGIVANGTDDLAVARDTWVYNASRNEWRNVTTAAHPQARHGAAAAYCPTMGGVLLFGGNRATDGTLDGLADTWLYYPGNYTWVELPLSGPSPRYDAQMVYDSSSGSVLLLGGFGSSQYDLIYDLWTLHEPVFLRSGTYTSRVYDLGGEAHFGDVILHRRAGLRPPSGDDLHGVTVQLRTSDSRHGLEGEAFVGNYTHTSRVDAVHNGSRFLQFRVELATGDPRSSPVLDRLEIAYNLMHSVELTSGGGDRSGVWNVTWEARDPDGDRLSFDVLVGNATGWTLVASDVQDTCCGLNTSAFENGDYLVKVEARDDNASIPLVNETVPQPFTIANDRPPTAWMLSPPDGANLTAGEVTLSWDSLDPDGDPVLFRVVLSRPGSGLDAPGVVVNTTGSNLTLVLREGRYQWTVVPRGGACTSGVWSFMVLPLPPPPPNRAPVCSLSGPEDGVEVPTGAALLTWEAWDPDGDVLEFTVHTRHLPMDGGEILYEDHATVELSIELLFPPGWVTWWVTASDGNASTKTASWGFSVPRRDKPPDEPPTVLILGPEDGAVLREGILTFEWTPSEDVLSSRLHISWDILEVAGLIGEGHGTMEGSISLRLHEGRYYWTVVVYDGTHRTKSEIRTLDVVPPLKVRIRQPADGASLSGTFVVSGRVDNVIEEVAVKVRVDGGEWQVAQGGRSWSATFNASALSRGPHRIEALAVEGDAEDTAGVDITIGPDAWWQGDVAVLALVLVIVAVLAAVFVVRMRVLRRGS